MKLRQKVKNIIENMTNQQKYDLLAELVYEEFDEYIEGGSNVIIGIFEKCETKKSIIKTLIVWLTIMGQVSKIIEDLDYELLVKGVVKEGREEFVSREWKYLKFSLKEKGYIKNVFNL